MDLVQRSRVTPAQGTSTTQNHPSGTFMKMEEATSPGKTPWATTERKLSMTSVFEMKGKEERMREEELAQFKEMRNQHKPYGLCVDHCPRCSELDFPNSRKGFEALQAAHADASVCDCEHFHTEVCCPLRDSRARSNLAFAKFSLPGRIDFKWDSQLACICITRG
jgi:hypothetical protein